MGEATKVVGTTLLPSRLRDLRSHEANISGCPPWQTAQNTRSRHCRVFTPRLFWRQPSFAGGCLTHQPGHTREYQQEASAEHARKRPDKTKRVPTISANSREKTPHLPTPLQPADSLGTREVTITRLCTEIYKLEKNASALRPFTPPNGEHIYHTTQTSTALPYLGFLIQDTDQLLREKNQVQYVELQQSLDPPILHNVPKKQSHLTTAPRVAATIH